MITSKTISFKTILAKVYRDLQLQDEDDLLVDCLEWCAEAIEAIGAYNQYTDKKASVTIKNYKGEVPCDFVELIQAKYNDFILLASTSIDLPKYDTTKYTYLTPTSTNQDKLNKRFLVDNSYYFGNQESFKISNGWIKTSFDKGFIEIAYLALNLDEDGFPMIPDEVSYKEALYWYIVYKISYAQSRRGEIHINFYVDAYDKWGWYRNQAATKAIMPDLSMMENLKRSFLSLKPNLYKFNSQFSR